MYTHAAQTEEILELARKTMLARAECKQAQQYQAVVAQALSVAAQMGQEHQWHQDTPEQLVRAHQIQQVRQNLVARTHLALEEQHWAHLEEQLSSAGWAGGNAGMGQLRQGEFGKVDCSSMTPAYICRGMGGPQERLATSKLHGLGLADQLRHDSMLQLGDNATHEGQEKNEADPNSLRACLREIIMNEDERCVFAARQINKFGFRAKNVLAQHFSQYGEVSRVLSPPSGTKGRRGGAIARPSNFALIVMKLPEAVQQILAEGSTHMVKGWPIQVSRYEPRGAKEAKMEDEAIEEIQDAPGSCAQDSSPGCAETMENERKLKLAEQLRKQADRLRAQADILLSRNSSRQAPGSQQVPHSQLAMTPVISRGTEATQEQFSISAPCNSLREHLKVVSAEDPRCVFVMRYIHKLGPHAAARLCTHFSWYGQVSQALIADKKNTLRAKVDGSLEKSKTRPGGLGFMIMESPDSVREILSCGQQQVVDGHPIIVEAFTPHKTNDQVDEGSTHASSQGTTGSIRGRHGSSQMSEDTDGSQDGAHNAVTHTYLAL
jgi:hypothetical protein